MTESITRSAEVAATGDGRTVTVRLCRWLDPQPVVDPRPGLGPAGMSVYREQWAVDSLEPAERIQVVDQHNGTLIGSGLPETLRSTPDGPEIDLRIVDSSIGDHQLALIREGHVTAVSMEATPDLRSDRHDGDLVTRTRARLNGVALTFKPAHDAPILATRSNPTQLPEEGNSMTTETTPNPGTTELPEDVVRTAQLDDLQRSLTERFDGIEQLHRTAAHPLAKFDTWGDYAHAVVHASPEGAEELQREYANALNEIQRATQTKTANPGLDRPQWLTEVAGSFARTRPIANAFGITPKRPGEGGTFSWPRYTGDISTLVGDQAAEGDAVTSVAVPITAGSTTADTWAGGSTISYQLVRNSTPAYLNEYRSLMSQGYAVHSESSLATKLAAADVASGTAVWDPATGTTEELVQALVQASIEVEAATGAPASFALIATDMLTAAVGKDGFMMGAYGAASGNSATQAGIQVPRLIHAPLLANGSLIVSNGEAATVFEDGPMVATVEQALNLGTDWAIWGQGAFGARIPNGLRSIPAS